MKRILTYTIGWDTIAKLGYLTAVVEDHSTYALSNLPLEELKILVDLLKENNVFIDQKNWIIRGWQGDTSANIIPLPTQLIP